MTAASHEAIRPLLTIIKGLLNKELQLVCQTHGLRTSGVKAELQQRIQTALCENYTADPPRFSDIRNTLMNLRQGRGQRSTTSNMGSSSATVPNNYSTSNWQTGGAPAMHQPAYSYSPGSGSNYRSNAYRSYDLRFKPSPFYIIESRIGETRTCEAMSQHRNSITQTVKTSDNPNLSRCLTDNSYRIMVFCAGDCAGDNQPVQDVAFPHQSELKVNGGDIKANLRGLKGKPGTTRPVDITHELRLKQSNYANTVEFTYALTNKVKTNESPRKAQVSRCYHSSSNAKWRPNPDCQKELVLTRVFQQKFYFAIFLCRMIPVDSLVRQIKGKKITTATVKQQIAAKANDPDIVTTSVTLSLKCPLSFTRLRTPCQSTLCNHIQCFDATSYLQLQEQGPQWICPICNNPAPFETLAVNEYVGEILQKTSDSTEQVTIEPDGQWKMEGAQREARRPRSSGVSASASIDDDDDIAVIGNSRGVSTGSFRGASNGAHAYNTPSRSLMGNGTPRSDSREVSGAPRSGSKRPAEVIDLTLSSDEDDAPIVPRAPKRPYHGPDYTGGHSLAFPRSSTNNY
ncbi:hypothetical protein F4780DRAFT_480675 [Xylariomycetidae sp. FL0641]|nr:hypothetical protein F4780DRAFT_480675 [Xylariomycetidae sp. FL0641]